MTPLDIAQLHKPPDKKPFVHHPLKGIHDLSAPVEANMLKSFSGTVKRSGCSPSLLLCQPVSVIILGNTAADDLGHEDVCIFKFFNQAVQDLVFTAVRHTPARASIDTDGLFPVLKPKNTKS